MSGNNDGKYKDKKSTTFKALNYDYFNLLSARAMDGRRQGAPC